MREEIWGWNPHLAVVLPIAANWGFQPPNLVFLSGPFIILRYKGLYIYHYYYAKNAWQNLCKLQQDVSQWLSSCFD